MRLADLNARDDNELIIHLNGGYGAEKCNMALHLVRAAMRTAEANTKAAVDEIMAGAKSTRLT